MKKLLLSCFICLSALSVTAQANWNNSAFVHRSGRQVLDGSNAPIRLEGVNLGGWILWEGWIWGAGYTAEKTVYTRMKNKVGQASADAFRTSVYANYITRKDIDSIPVSGTSFILNLENFRDGIYFIRSDQSGSAQKLIVQH